MPVHFLARYLDGRGQVHRLEEWRVGQRHLRRTTDDRIDLHADAVNANRVEPQRGSAQPLDYIWHIIDMRKRIDHRVSTAGMLHLGMLYSYYSMAHVLSRPAGAFTVRPSSDPGKSGGTVQGSLSSAVSPASQESCTWWQIDAADRPATRVCWWTHYGIPGRTFVQTPKGWQLDFTVDAIDTHPLAPAIFTVDTKGLQVRDVDEIESED